MTSQLPCRHWRYGVVNAKRYNRFKVHEGELVAAEQREPNERLAQVIAETGLTYEAVAHAVRAVAAENGEILSTNKSAVSHWTKGVQPSGQASVYVAEALSRHVRRVLTPADLGLTSVSSREDVDLGLVIGPDPVGTLTHMWRADLDRRRFLAASAYSVAASVMPLEHVQEVAERAEAARRGGVAGAAEVAAVRDMVRMFTAIDERHGGQHGRSALVQYLMTDVATLCRGRFRTDDDRAQLLSAAAVGVHLAGWKAYDSGEQGLAQRYYHQSYALAVESGVIGHDGFVLRTMAQQGMKLRHPQYSLALADSGLSRAHGHVDTKTEALFAITRAHALATAGQRKAAVREVQQARDCLSAAQGDEMPFWATSWGPAEATIRSRSAKVFARLGDRQGAAESYAAAAAARPAGTYSRIHALDLNAQAKMELSQGSIEQACDTWGRALDSMAGIASVRTKKAVRGMRTDLARFRTRGVRDAQELDERARAWLRETA